MTRRQQTHTLGHSNRASRSAPFAEVAVYGFSGFCAGNEHHSFWPFTAYLDFCTIMKASQALRTRNYHNRIAQWNLSGTVAAGTIVPSPAGPILERSLLVNDLADGLVSLGRLSPQKMGRATLVLVDGIRGARSEQQHRFHHPEQRASALDVASSRNGYAGALIEQQVHETLSEAALSSSVGQWW
ncbi:hypothetical protein BDV97DRAFT_398287 [Delphinella strobiligena]|nr:hypothetical protein BDV97DRAFT_398287 [Delphinella strobiligena]